jgi:hypothetical protein
MSFDIFLESVRRGTILKKVRNPLTKVVATVMTGGGLDAAERAEVRAVLAAAGAAKADEFGCYIIDLPDNGSAEVFASDLDGEDECNGMMVACRSFTPQLAAFVLDLMRRGRMGALPASEPAVYLVTSDDLHDSRPEGYEAPAITVATAEELLAAVSGGFAAWEKYRRQITG